MWDTNGNYIESKQDKLNKKAKAMNASFVLLMDKFLSDNNISGTPYTYGFATSRSKLNASLDKLTALNIKYTLDYTPHFHVKVLINKSQF